MQKCGEKPQNLLPQFQPLGAAAAAGCIVNFKQAAVHLAGAVLYEVKTHRHLRFHFVDGQFRLHTEHGLHRAGHAEV